MAQTQIQLANTFNEFRSAYNNAANTIDSLETTLNSITGGGGSGINVGTVTANVINANTYVGNNFTSGRLLFGNAAGHIVGDSGLNWSTSNNHLLATNVLTGNGYFSSSLRAATVQANNLTSGRLVIAGGSGALSDDAELRYDTGNNAVLAANVAIDNELKVSSLTNGRVVLAGTGGALTDDSGITFDTGSNALTVNGSVSAYNVAATFWSNAANQNISTNSTVGGTVTVGANVNVTDTVNALGHLHAGGVETWIANKSEDRDIHLIAAVDDSDGPHDIAIVNRNNSANAYGEFIAMNNAGNTSQGWVSMGINSTNYNQGAFAITEGDDAYLLYQAPEGTTKEGNLVIGTGGNGTANKIIFSANGFDDPANNTQLTIEPGVRVHVEVPTQSTSTTTGALTVAGGVGIVGNMNVGGNVAITGTITLTGSGNTVSTDTLAVANAILFLANGNSSDSLDIGYVGQYNNNYFGVVRDRANNRINIFQDLATRPANTTNFGAVNYANTRTGVLHASNTTAATSHTSGALIVTGGAGIAGTVWAGGTIRTDATTATTSTSTGALIIAGGAGIAGNTHIGGYLRTTDTTPSITTGTGALIVGGGAGIGGAINTGGVINVGDATESTTTSSGSIVTNGGIGAAKNVFVGGTIATTNTTASTSTTTGALRSAGGLGVAGAAYVGGIVNVGDTTDTSNATSGSVVLAGGIGVAKGAFIGGTLTTTKVAERTSDVTGNGVTTFNTTNSHVFAVSPTANFTANFTNVATTVSQVQVMTLIITQGATKYDLQGVQIGGVSQTIRWAGNVVPTFTANKTEIVVFTLIRSSGGTWTVTGQLSQYG